MWSSAIPQTRVHRRGGLWQDHVPGRPRAVVKSCIWLPPGTVSEGISSVWHKMLSSIYWYTTLNLEPFGLPPYSVSCNMILTWNTNMILTWSKYIFSVVSIQFWWFHIFLMNFMISTWFSFLTWVDPWELLIFLTGSFRDSLLPLFCQKWIYAEKRINLWCFKKYEIGFCIFRIKVWIS